MLTVTALIPEHQLEISELPGYMCKAPLIWWDGVQVSSPPQNYVVYRRIPLLGRYERTLAIDRDYVRLIPSTRDTWSFSADATRTISYHMRTVTVVRHGKTSATFRITVHWNNGEKQHDLEAEGPDLAGERLAPVHTRTILISLQRKSCLQSRVRRLACSYTAKPPISSNKYSLESCRQSEDTYITADACTVDETKRRKLRLYASKPWA
jgi:hypothetical protein